MEFRIGTTERLYNVEMGSIREHFTYVGCIHGGDDEFLNKLEKISDYPQDILILTGDLGGSSELVTLQRFFYNYVRNRAAGELRVHECDISDDELLSYIGFDAPEQGLNLRDAYKSLFRYLLILEGLDGNNSKSVVDGLTDGCIASEIRKISGFPYFGDWAASLSLEIRQRLINSVEDNMTRLVMVLKRFQSNGTRVVVVAGNWDDRRISGFRQICGEDIVMFDPKRILDESGILFMDRVGALETKKTLHLFFPFAELLETVEEKGNKNQEFAEVLENQFALLSDWTQIARKLNKKIVFVAHTEANAEVHGHSHNISEIKPIEKQWAINNLMTMIYGLHPDVIFYGHEHRPINSGYKYFIRSGWDGTHQISEGVENAIEVVHLPFHSVVSVSY